MELAHGHVQWQALAVVVFNQWIQATNIQYSYKWRNQNSEQSKSINRSEDNSLIQLPSRDQAQESSILVGNVW